MKALSCWSKNIFQILKFVQFTSEQFGHLQFKWRYKRLLWNNRFDLDLYYASKSKNKLKSKFKSPVTLS